MAFTAKLVSKTSIKYIEIVKDRNLVKFTGGFDK